MRVTRETRERTRQALLDAAERCFAERGFAAATTREIAAAAGVAAGTLFNYFPSKEALGLALLVGAGEAAEAELEAATRPAKAAPASLEEALFARVAAQLRHFAPYRAWVGEVLDAGWSPLLAAGETSPAADFCRRLSERVEALLAAHGLVGERTAVDRHLYWTLYLGTLSFWARDDTEHQQATLALLDRSMALFCRSLREDAAGPHQESGA